MDLRWFPFDVQKCELKFGSWTYGGWSVDLKLLQADTSSYIPNGEWDLVGERGQGGLGRCSEFELMIRLQLSFLPEHTVFPFLPQRLKDRGTSIHTFAARSRTLTLPTPW